MQPPIPPQPPEHNPWTRSLVEKLFRDAPRETKILESKVNPPMYTSIECSMYRKAIKNVKLDDLYSTYTKGKGVTGGADSRKRIEPDKSTNTCGNTSSKRPRSLRFVPDTTLVSINASVIDAEEKGLFDNSLMNWINEMI